MSAIYGAVHVVKVSLNIIMSPCLASVPDRHGSRLTYPVVVERDGMRVPEKALIPQAGWRACGAHIIIKDQ